jgi:hypothetical protein
MHWGTAHAILHFFVPRSKSWILASPVQSDGDCSRKVPRLVPRDKNGVLYQSAGVLSWFLNDRKHPSGDFGENRHRA